MKTTLKQTFLGKALRAACPLMIGAALAMPVQAQEDNPILNAWYYNSTGVTGTSTDAEIEAVVSQVLADVIRIHYDDTYVYVESNSIPSHTIGPFNDGNPSIPGEMPQLFRFPFEEPQPAANPIETPLSAMGMFVNGVQMFNFTDATSWNDLGIWNTLAVIARADGMDSGLGHPAPGVNSGGGGDDGGGDGGDGTPPDGGGGTPPDGGDGGDGGTPPDGGGDGGGGTPPDGGGDGGGGTPPDGGGDGGGGTPPDGGGDGGGGTPPDGGGQAPNAIASLAIAYQAKQDSHERHEIHAMMHDQAVPHSHGATPSQDGGDDEINIGTYHYHVSPPLLRDQLGDDGSDHSPILGMLHDGIPIYGGWGYANADGTGGIVLIQPSFRLRDVTDRTTLADGTVLSDDEHGPPFSDRYPQGYYAEDYEYIPGLGHLDEFNGRFCVTPEFPEGRYCYFATIDEDGTPVFPYLIGENYYADMDNANRAAMVNIPAGAIEFVPTTTVSSWSMHE